MAVVMSGVIDIPSEEFWGWVQDETNDTDTIYHPKLDCCRDELTINLTPVDDNKPSVSLDMAAFWSFVLGYTPEMASMFIRHGKPSLDNHSITIDFIAGSHSLETYAEPYQSQLRKIEYSWKG